MKKLLLTAALLLVPSLAVYAETLTLSTYYPAPFGAYERLRLVPRPSAGMVCNNDTMVGTLYSEEGTPAKLRYCNEDAFGLFSWGPIPGVWAQDASDNVFLSDTTNTNLQVGIGMTNPETKLDVNGIVASRQALVVAGIGPGGGYPAGNNWYQFQDSSGDLNLGRNGWNPILEIERTTNNVIFNTGPGNVGIGTTAPVNKLDVEGAVAIGATYSGTNTAPANGLIVEGNVGIGGASPSTKLQVNTAALSTDGVFIRGSDSHNIYLRGSMFAGANNGIVQSGDTGIIYSNGLIDTGAFVIAPWASATSGIRMNAGGSVGIGTASPQSTLHVAGAVTFEPLSAPPTSYTRGTMYYDGNNNLFKYWNGTEWIELVSNADPGMIYLATFEKDNNDSIIGPNKNGYNNIDGWQFQNGDYGSGSNYCPSSIGQINSESKFHVDISCVKSGKIRVIVGVSPNITPPGSDNIGVDGCEDDDPDFRRRVKIWVEYSFNGTSWWKFNKFGPYMDIFAPAGCSLPWTDGIYAWDSTEIYQDDIAGAIAKDDLYIRVLAQLSSNKLQTTIVKKGLYIQVIRDPVIK